MTDQLFTNDEALRIIAVLLDRLGGDAQFIAAEDMVNIGNPTVEIMTEVQRDGFRIRAWNKNDRFPPGPARKTPLKAQALRLSTPELEALDGGQD